jgi:sigma-B regulation protein RsbU (phosphoserine phosphatase)
VDSPHVQVILDENHVPGPLRAALGRVKARVSLRSLDRALTDGISPTADLCVILPGRHSGPDVLGRVLADASERACATMVLDPDDDPAARKQATPHPVRQFASAGEDTATLNADELTGRIKALCDIRSPMRRMNEELNRLRRRDAQTNLGTRYFDEQLRLAGEIQRDLLPDAMPDTAPLTIHTLYLPADFVSGDIYDVSRLDEDHVGLSIADATGHGLPAALLTFLVKNSFRGKTIHGDSYRIREPDEVLAGLNAELLGTRLSGCQFITALHAVLNRTACQIRWARGGLPYPVLIRPHALPRRLASNGCLVGAFENPCFEVTTHHFEPGDTLLFFTDGLEALLLKHDQAFSTGQIEDSTWVRRVSKEGPAAAMAAIRKLASEIPDQVWRKDDIALLAVEMAK